MLCEPDGACALLVRVHESARAASRGIWGCHLSLGLAICQGISHTQNELENNTRGEALGHTQNGNRGLNQLR